MTMVFPVGKSSELKLEEEDILNLDVLLTDVLINTIRELRDKTHTRPPSVSDLETWQQTLDFIVRGLEEYREAVEHEGDITSDNVRKALDTLRYYYTELFF